MTAAFENVAMAPRDPILGLNEQYNADERTQKVNLGVGVYCDDEGHLPLLKAVRAAEEAMVKNPKPRGYLPINGLASYDQAAQVLLFGQGSEVVESKRATTVESLGGTGGLKVGADFLHTLYPNSTVYVSNPTWGNHNAIFKQAGFKVESYPYYDAQTHGLDFEALKAFFKTMPERSIPVLHACCHNPTGVDPSHEQWQELVQIIKDRNLIPFVDIAYQGFGVGLQEDAYVVRLFAEQKLDMLVSSSFSKSFSLYGERVGALTVVTQNKDQAERVLSQVKAVIRANYSNPPTHGATVVSMVLNTPELYKSWEDELSHMRVRIKQMRGQLVQAIKDAGVTKDFDFVNQQNGMFSFSGLTKDQVERLRTEFGIYAVGSGRICVAALNSKNVQYVAQSIAKVL